MDKHQFNEGLLNFLRASPTPFHAVHTMSSALKQSGFIQLHEANQWDLDSPGRYFLTRNESSIIAFTLGTEPLPEAGFRMAGAHTDSPCLKIKPLQQISEKEYFQLGIEVYGGALLNPWFDRDLSIAGRIYFITAEQEILAQLVDFERPIACIPSLAIHLDREANKNRTINPQNHLPPVLLQQDPGQSISWPHLLKQYLHNQYQLPVYKVLEHELYLYDTQPPQLIGWNKEFIASARLDNLLSCYVGLMSLLESNEQTSTLLVCYDHEEVGSQSACGAQSPFLSATLERLFTQPQALQRCLTNSLLMSIDNAHGIHPNYSERYDQTNGPIINRGPVIKMNANQKYASNSETSAIFRYCCQQAGVPTQTFAIRADMNCGSTIGPISASNLGIRTVDVGVPQWAMHSIRETAGTQDAYNLHRALSFFFSLSDLPG